MNFRRFGEKKTHQNPPRIITPLEQRAEERFGRPISFGKILENSALSATHLRHKMRSDRLEDWLLKQAREGAGPWHIAFRFGGNMEAFSKFYRAQHPEDFPEGATEIDMPVIWQNAFITANLICRSVFADPGWKTRKNSATLSKALQRLQPFIRKELSKYIRTISAQDKEAMGGYASFEAEGLYAEICEALAQTLERYSAQETVERTSAWLEQRIETVLQNNPALSRKMERVRAVEEAWQVLSKELRQDGLSKEEFKNLFAAFQARYGIIF